MTFPKGVRAQVPADRAAEPGMAASQLTLRQLRDAVRGRLPDVSRAEAIEALVRSGFPNAHRDLQAVLEDDTAPSTVRFHAATSIAHTDARAASQILIAATAITDQRVLAGVMRALGQVGGRDALAAIERVLPRTTGNTRSHAGFAAMLIAHRVNADGYDAPVPEASAFIDMRADAGAPLFIRPAPRQEAERSLISLGSRPYGVELAERPMYEFHCDRCSGMIMLNRDFTDTDALARLRRRKALFAVGALRDADGDARPAAVLLTSPVGKGERIRISVHLTSGDQVFAGDAAVSGDAAAWQLRAVRRLGAFPVRAEGRFVEGHLEIAFAASGTRIIQQARPSAYMPDWLRTRVPAARRG